MESRRKFLYELGILTAGMFIPRYTFGKNKNNLEEQAKKDCLKILYKKENFLGYSKPQFSKEREYLREEGLEKVVKSSLDLLSKDEEDYIFLNKKKNIDLDINLFRKLISPSPPYVLPIASKTLEKVGKTDKDEVIGLFSTIEKNGEKRGFWYGEADDEDEDANRFSVPYFDNEKILIYGVGKRYGVEGEILGMVKYKQKGLGKVETDTSCFLNIDVPFPLSLASFFIKDLASKKLLNNAIGLQTKAKDFIDILDDKNIRWIEKNFQKEKVDYVKSLINIKEGYKKF